MPELLSIRPMVRDDLEAVVAIERRAFSHPWSRKLYEDALSSYQCHVLEQQGRHLGHVVMQYIFDEAHLLNIVVAVEQQGRGLGRRLLEFALEQARQRSSVSCFLEVRESNRAAYALYERYGFNEIDRRRNYYPTTEGHEDALVMVCTLADEWMLIQG
ncbi:MAG: ribosomal protein S18-alanine N-acetyltransferase [Gammaproteobacteria bacterium]|jgi:ribosomal-protein-alanine N-acetyltransferase|nr:ribosomal protein S18-alanine N-acetyltransferase [Gammaproteobacteria bacterium]